MSKGKKGNAKTAPDAHADVWARIDALAEEIAGHHANNEDAPLSLYFDLEAAYDQLRILEGATT